MFQSQPVSRLQGRRILVVEDDFIAAEELCDALRAVRTEVLGPVPSIARALDLLDATPLPHGATLDVNLGGEMSYAVADRLRLLAIPFVIVTGYACATLFMAHDHVPCCEKPVCLGRLVALLAARM